jgi:2-(acetamidomethylene)succinate hydrolase
MVQETQDFAPRDVVLTPDLTIHYFHRAGDGINLVFLHNSSGYGRMWDGTAKALSPNFNVFALDQRGHGDSSRPEGDYSADEYAEDLRAFVERLGLKKIVVAGASLGGRVALTFAALHPELTDALILVGGPHRSNFFQTEAAVRTVLSNAYDIMVMPTEFPSRDATLEYFETSIPLESYWRQGTEFALLHRVEYNMNHAPDGRVSVKYDPHRVAQGLTHMLTNLRPYAAKIRCSVAFIRAIGTHHLTPETAEELAKFFPNPVDTYSVAAEGKVSLQMENASGLAQAITDFVVKRL